MLNHCQNHQSLLVLLEQEEKLTQENIEDVKPEEEKEEVDEPEKEKEEVDEPEEVKEKKPNGEKITLDRSFFNPLIDELKKENFERYDFRISVAYSNLEIKYQNQI